VDLEGGWVGKENDGKNLRRKSVNCAASLSL